MESIKETLQLLSMKVAEMEGPVIGPLSDEQAAVLDNRILGLMYKAYCLGRKHALKQQQQEADTCD